MSSAARVNHVSRIAAALREAQAEEQKARKAWVEGGYDDGSLEVLRFAVGKVEGLFEAFEIVTTSP